MLGENLGDRAHGDEYFPRALRPQAATHLSFTEDDVEEAVQIASR